MKFQILRKKKAFVDCYDYSWKLLLEEDDTIHLLRRKHDLNSHFVMAKTFYLRKIAVSHFFAYSDKPFLLKLYSYMVDCLEEDHFYNSIHSQFPIFCLIVNFVLACFLKNF